MNLNEVFLLGAGASAEAGLLTSTNLTSQIRECFWAEDRDKDWQTKTIDFVIAGLIFERGIHGLNPLTGIDVERFVAAIRSLANRTYLETTPFVGSWHPRIAELERIHGFNWLELEKLTYRFLRSLLWISDATKLSYLEPLLDRFKKHGNLVIATLNYDNVVETLFNANGIDTNDGIDYWEWNRQFEFDDGRVNLLKLHGSVDWVYEDHLSSDSRPIQQRLVSRLPMHMITKNPQLDPALVFGEGNKLTASGPFLELFEEFRRQLARTHHLVVVGYSFRDTHINQAIADWVNAGPENRITVICRNPDQLPCEFMLNLMAYYPNRVDPIPATAGVGLKRVKWDDLHQRMVSG